MKYYNKGIYRVWINAPSTLQNVHQWHRTNGIAQMELPRLTIHPMPSFISFLEM